MRIFFIIIFFQSIAQSCYQVKSCNYDVRIDYRFASSFHSIFLCKEGNGYIIKGVGTNYTEPLEIYSSDTSRNFKLDSVNFFYDRLEGYKTVPYTGAFRVDAQRTEIYYQNRKIYDGYRSDEYFWALIKPIMEQLPANFNPFLFTQ